MRSLKWSISNAVFVTEIDDEHKEIFAALADLQKALKAGGSAAETSGLTQRLIAAVGDHFAHEERLMRAARYTSIRWHKQQHDNARKRVGQFVMRMEQIGPGAGGELVAYLTGWLHNHTQLADRMMGAFLRNHRRVGTITLRAGTRPMDACEWVDSKGERFDPARP